MGVQNTPAQDLHNTWAIRAQDASPVVRGTGCSPGEELWLWPAVLGVEGAGIEVWAVIQAHESCLEQQVFKLQARLQGSSSKPSGLVAFI